MNIVLTKTQEREATITYLNELLLYDDTLNDAFKVEIADVLRFVERWKA